MALFNIQKAGIEDMPRVAAVFLAAFPQTTARLLRSPAALRGPEDLFSCLWQLEPGAFHLVQLGQQVAGYIITPCDLTPLTAFVLRSGWGWRWVQGAFRGTYRLRWQGVFPTMLDQIIVTLKGRDPQHPGRILSLAVHPCWQGKGLGRILLGAGLGYLKNQGVRGVRLEVREDNLPARTLYQGSGFCIKGEFRNTQGRWLIMNRSLG